MIGKCIREYKHGRTQFKPGVFFTVPDMIGGFLAGVSCLEPVDEVPEGVEHVVPTPEELGSAAPPLQPKDGVTLSVQDVAHVASSPKVG